MLRPSLPRRLTQRRFWLCINQIAVPQYRRPSSGFATGGTGFSLCTLLVAFAHARTHYLECLYIKSSAMGRQRYAFITGLLLLGLSGCGQYHFRPTGVPSSAVWADHTFIDCSGEANSKLYRCTVFKDDTGEVLAEGIFRLNKTHGPAETKLHYAAFGDGRIFLEDTRVLMQTSASPRDPSHRIIADRMRTLASHGGSTPIDCGAPNTAESPAKCALKAFADKKPFFVRWYLPSDDSFRYAGIALDSSGAAWSAIYVGGNPLWVSVKLPDQGQDQAQDQHQNFFDDGHTLVLPCPSPVVLTEDARGVIDCYKPVGDYKPLSSHNLH
jgi:hypothetical protein